MQIYQLLHYNILQSLENKGKNYKIVAKNQPRRRFLKENFAKQIIMACRAKSTDQNQQNDSRTINIVKNCDSVCS